MAPTIQAGDIVRVTNQGDRAFTIMYDSRTYRLEPGQESIMPLEAAILWFGDPRASESMQSVVDERGLRSYIPDRESEVRRLRVKYDNQLGDERVILNHPIVSVATVNGEPVQTVLDDPSGASVIAAVSTQQQQTELMGIIARQQKQIDLLMQHATNQQQMMQPTNPGFVQPETGQDAQTTSASNPSAPNPTMTVPAPSIPGIPPVPPTMPSDLEVVDHLPEDGDIVTESGAPIEEGSPVALSSLPQDDAEFSPSPPADAPPADA